MSSMTYKDKKNAKLANSL